MSLMVEFKGIRRLTEQLWHQSTSEQLHSGNPASLRLYDQYLMEQYSHIFGEVIKDEKPQLTSFRRANKPGVTVRVGYGTHQEDQDLRLLIANWGRNQWHLGIQLYHSPVYHRLDAVEIKHQGILVGFHFPKRYLGGFVPTGVLPTDVEVKLLVAV